MCSPSQARLKALATTLEETEDRLDQVERQRRARLEALTSTASQVNNKKKGWRRKGSAAVPVAIRRNNKNVTDGATPTLSIDDSTRRTRKLTFS